MSRIAKSPITIPSDIKISLNDNLISIIGKLGKVDINVNSLVTINNADNILTFGVTEVDKKNIKNAWAQAGTARANVANFIKGVATGWEKQLTLVGVGYRAKVSGKKLNLSLGFSHPIEYDIPDGVTIETPSQTQIIVKGIDKQKVGQVSAEVRSYRKPEPYKGKGVRYSDEQVVRKVAKKK
jgi:large subunit ribosomal protein L6